ncbi:hypothetical protein ACEN8I_01050 [Polaromonas sp. CT11-55]|uniref:hypothetical protein n=1 Tax=Polaromonas sp. CT11-55 TaxID=3243045 RepID=UPI0039A71ACC
MPPENIDPEVAAAVERLSAVAADEVTLERLQNLRYRVGTRLLFSKGNEALFGMQAFIREDHPEYRFFVMGRLLEVRRLGGFSDKYSLVDFPAEMEAQRQLVQEKFSTLFVATDEGLGWFAPTPWEQLGEAQKAMCRPKFVEDNLRSHLM